MVCTSVPILVVTLISFGFSSQTDRNLQEPPPLTRSRSSLDRPDIGSDSGFPPPAGQYSSDRTSPQEPPIRARSRSPSVRPPTDRVLGFEIEQLGYVRLISHKNRSKRFQFRRYVFPADQSFRLRVNNKIHVLDTTHEHIVLVASNGDVCAILDQSGILRGILSSQGIKPRVKINMISGAVDDLTADEKRDCPIGKHHPVFPNSFMKAYADLNSLQSEDCPRGKHDPGSCSFDREHPSGSSVRQESFLRQRYWSPLDRPPSHKLLGYSLEKLGYIRLIPQANPDQQFEFRKYIFPVSERIQMLQVNGGFSPLPNLEYIVLSASNGDIFAILENTGILRGIYKRDGKHWRIKINMISGAVGRMTGPELQECHIGENYPVFPRWFTKVVTNEDSLQHSYQ